MRSNVIMALAVAILAAPMAARAQYAPPAAVGKSEVGPDDELGRLSWMTNASRSAAMAKAAGKVYDLATDYFIGMPSFNGLGDPPYQYWLTHTPRGNVVDDPGRLAQRRTRKSATQATRCPSTTTWAPISMR